MPIRRRITGIMLLLLAAGLAPAIVMAAETPAATQARIEARQKAAAAMLADIREATWVVDGKGGRIIYIFFDPNCPFCHKLYESLRPWVRHGEVEARWIPIGTLMTTSPGKAAAILEAANPTEALAKNELEFSRETGTFGGITEEPLPQPETTKRLQANLALLRRSGNDGVPLMLFRLKDGTPMFIPGAPPAAFLEKLIGDLE